MNALQFDYINHKGEDHSYKVIPISIAFEPYKLYPDNLSSKAWVINALVLERSKIKRNVLRNFVVMRMRNIAEVSVETR